MNTVKKFICFFLSVILVFSFAGCGRKYEADSFTVNKKEAALKVSSDTDKKSLHISKNRSSLVSVAKSDMIELYFDKENFSISVYDTASGKLWNSLPSYDMGIKTSVIAVTVLIDGNRYVLSSQSDSVGFSAAGYELQEKGVSVRYTFKKSFEDGRTIDITVPVSYVLTDGALNVEVDCDYINGKDNDRDIIITDIDVLPFFGANRDVRESDYMLIPDGSGATVTFSENPTEFEDINLPVYENGVLLGAFGMKNSDSAFAALIDEGSEISTVKCTKALKSKGCNSVYASFRITDTMEKENTVYVSSESYKGKIGIAYRFLSFGNAGYTGMAGAVRELLIRDGRLLSVAADEGRDYPFNMSLIFQNHITDTAGNILSQTLTTYEQAMEILNDVKAKGIENINLTLKGIFTSDNIKKPELSDRPGKLKELRALIDYGRSSGVTFYAEADIMTVLQEKAADAPAVSLDGARVKHGEKTVVCAKSIPENVNSLLSLMRSDDIGGVYVSDAGRFLYDDYSLSCVALKDRVAEKVAGELAALSASEKLSVDTGNIYAVKYASSIVNLPLGRFSDRKLCEGVPFVQAILHGLTEYSLSPVNTDSNPEKAFLKAVEYGAVPSYELYASDLSTEEKADNCSYLNYLTSAQSQYERASSCFSDLMGARITDHYRVKKNVYYTQYDNSTGIYVNYNEKPVTVSGVTVEGMSFIRVG